MSNKRRYCPIVCCENNKGTLDPDISFFRVPFQSTKIRQKWDDAIKKLYNMENLGDVLLCQLHFHPDDLCLLGNKHILRYGAVPKIAINPVVEVNLLGNVSKEIKDTHVKEESYVDEDVCMVEDPHEKDVYMKGPHEKVKYIDLLENDTNTDAKEDSNYCVQCLNHEIINQKNLEKLRMYQKKCERFMNENKIFRTQLKYFNDKCNALANQGKIQKFEPTVSCEVCCELLTPTELKQHLCMSEAQIICEYCSRSFSTTIEFRNHLNMQNHPKAKMYRCDRCEMVFPSSILLKFHQESNLAHPATIISDDEDTPMNKLFMCALCDAGFALTAELRKHVKKVHIDRMVNLVYQSIPTDKNSNENRFECYICKLGLNNISEVKRHLKQHIAARNKKCVVCNEYLTLNELNEHICHHKKKLSCGYCDRTFDVTSELLKHSENTHEDRILYQCRKCSQFYDTIELRQLHEKTHKKELKPFICEICLKGFSEKNSLKIHAHVHSNRRDYLCSECGKEFKTALQLKRHSVVHAEKTIKCPECPLTFRHVQVFRLHLGIHQNVKYNCDDCGKILSSKVSLNKHKNKVHKKKNWGGKLVQCTFCSMEMPSKNIEVHMRQHTGEKPFDCQYCPDRKYAYKQDLLKHLIKDHKLTTPYQCEVCKKKFRRYLDLRRHRCEEYKKHEADVKTQKDIELNN